MKEQAMKPYPIFDRQTLDVKPLEARDSGMVTADLLDPSAEPPDFTAFSPKLIEDAATLEDLRSTFQHIVDAAKKARAHQAGVMITYGAHLIKNGAGPILIEMMRQGHITHLATNAAGAIHDWELAYFGQTTEDVRRYVHEGQFGIWHETGFHMNLAAILGWADGLGYGQALGRMVATNQMVIPTVAQLDAEIDALRTKTADESVRYQIAGKQHLKLLLLTDTSESSPLASPSLRGLIPGEYPVWHPGDQETFHVEHSVLGVAYQLGIPVTIHKGLGYDIIDTHPCADGAAIGATGYRDFLTYTQSQTHLEGGLYCCVGSAVMGPMVFEKAQSMVNNQRLQNGQAAMSDFLIVVNDIQRVGPDWRDEPTADKPGYYHRFTKTFRRMGGEFIYFEADNRAFLHNLYRQLSETS